MKKPKIWAKKIGFSGYFMAMVIKNEDLDKFTWIKIITDLLLFWGITIILLALPFPLNILFIPGFLFTIAQSLGYIRIRKYYLSNKKEYDYFLFYSNNANLQHELLHIRRGDVKKVKIITWVKDELKELLSITDLKNILFKISQKNFNYSPFDITYA